MNHCSKAITSHLLYDKILILGSVFTNNTASLYQVSSFEGVECS